MILGSWKLWIGLMIFTGLVAVFTVIYRPEDPVALAVAERAERAPSLPQQRSQSDDESTPKLKQPGLQKLITADRSVNVYLDATKVGVMTQPKKLRFAGVISYFKTPTMITDPQGTPQPAAAFLRFSAYDCGAGEVTLIRGIFLDHTGEMINGSRSPGDAVKVNGDTKTSRAAELEAVCKLEGTKLHLVDGPRGYLNLENLLMGKDEPPKRGSA